MRIENRSLLIADIMISLDWIRACSQLVVLVVPEIRFVTVYKTFF